MNHNLLTIIGQFGMDDSCTRKRLAFQAKSGGHF